MIEGHLLEESSLVVLEPPVKESSLMVVEHLLEESSLVVLELGYGQREAVLSCWLAR